MARLPNWRQEQPRAYAVPSQNWGSGIDPIHQKRQGNESRNLTQTTYDPAPTGLISGEWDYGIEGYRAGGMDTRFMDVRPNWGERGRPLTANTYPDWGDDGYTKRSRPEGVSPRDDHINVIPRGIAGEGWRNKLTSFVLNSVSSDPNQLLIRTSERQLNLSKGNGSAVARGTDAPRADIATRVTPMRLKVYSGGIRHYDMEPRQHTALMRPWRYRGVGIGPKEWDEVNSMTTVTPITREIPPDVWQGPPETSIENYDTDADGWWY